MKTVFLLVSIAAVVAVIELVRRRRVAAPAAGPRAQQKTEGGKPIVDEWGEGSFPASDPPQSW